MKHKKTFKLVLAVFTVLAVCFVIFLYFYKLGSVPNGFYVDEATYAYNAYSILKTGKDEFGKHLPIIFRFYGSFNATLYVYLSVLIFKFLGLSVFSARLGSVVAGLLSILVYYFILIKLRIVKNKHTVFISTILFAITPWLFFYSRIGYEIVLGYLLFSAGVLFFILGLKKDLYYTISFVFFALSTYAAYTERYVVFLIIIPLILIYKKNTLNRRSLKYVVAGLFILFLTQIPFLTLARTPAFFTKESLFYKSLLDDQSTKTLTYFPYSVGFVLAFIREFLSKFITYLSPRSLFFLPDPDLQRSMPELSVYYQWMIIPFILGLFRLPKIDDNKKTYLICILIVVSCIPASLTNDPFSTHRAFPLLLPTSLIISIGIDYILEKRSIMYNLSLLVLFSVSLVLLWRSYFVLLPNERAGVWGYGIKDLAQIISKNPNKKFMIDTSRMKPIYINLAFYLAYPPDKFQMETDSKIKENYYYNTNYSVDKKFANIDIRGINWNEDIYKNQILVGDALAISEGQAKNHFLTKRFEIKDPLGYTLFVGYETNPEAKCKSVNYKDRHCRDLM